MLSKPTLKQLATASVTFGLLASPLAVGNMHEASSTDPAAPASDPTTQPSYPGSQQDPGSMADPGAQQDPGSMADPGAQPPTTDPNAQGQPADEPGFGEGTEPMPGADDPTADEDPFYEEEEEEMPWEETDDEDDEPGQ